jgi:polar amino acid transport system substrate-binding protein
MNLICRCSVLAVLSLGFLPGRLVADDAAVQPAPLRVGVNPTLPPMVYREGKNIVGVEAEFAQELGTALGRPVKFVPMDWDELIPALEGDKIDIIMSSMSVTRPRAYRVAFCQPYLTVGQMPLVRRTDLSKYAFGFPLQPEGVFGLKKSTTADFLVQQEWPKNKRKYFDSGEDAAKALAKGKIDLYISDSTMILWLEGMNSEAGLASVPVFLSEEHLAWAVRKSDSALLQSVNAALDKLQKSGRAKEIIKHWIPQYR